MTVPATPVSRSRTPIIFVAYGAGGGDWLRLLENRCMQSAPLRDLIQQHVVQFWCLGATGTSSEFVRAFPDGPTTTDATAALDIARSANATAAFPELSVRDVRVLERISLFDPGVGERRKSLKSALDQVPGVEAQSTRGAQGFRYQWTALADAVRESTGAQSKVSHTTAGSTALSLGDNILTFVVERSDSASAVIDAPLANRCLVELAMSFVQGDIGAVRSDGVPVTLPAVVREVQLGHVVPFGVAVLEHPWQDIEKARGRSFQHKVTEGVAERRHLDDKLGSSRVLSDALQKDRVALDESRFDRHARRRARQEAFQSTLAWLFAEGDVSWMRSHLVGIQRDLQALSFAGQSLNSQFEALPLGALIPLTVSGTSAIWAIGGSAAVAVVTTFIRKLRKRRREEIDGTKGVGPGTGADGVRASMELREDVRREWDELVSQLRAVIDMWETYRTNAVREMANQPSNAVEPWLPAPPIGRRLADSLAQAAEELPITAELCRDLAQQCVKALEANISADEAFSTACLRELRKWENKHHTVGTAVSDYLRRALSQERTSSLRQFIANRPYLANPTLPPVREAVVWMTAPSFDIQQSLLELEDLGARAAGIVLSHDDDERSVRLSFAQPVPWHAISTLEFSKS